jgi:hypothetical protein
MSIGSKSQCEVRSSGGSEKASCPGTLSSFSSSPTCTLVDKVMLRNNISLLRQCASGSSTRWIVMTRLARPASTTTTALTTATSSEDLHVSNPASRPYARHRPTLPNPKSYKLPAFGIILFSIVSWSAFTIHATNRERLSSSVLKNVMEKIKDDPSVQSKLGDSIGLERKMILAGDPWINGSVSLDVINSLIRI